MVRDFTAGGNGTSWTDPANWPGGNVPNTLVGSAVIDAGGSFAVTVDSTIGFGALTVGSDDTLSVPGGNLEANGLTDIQVALTVGGVSFLGYIAGGGIFNHGTMAPGHGASPQGRYMNIAGPVFLQPTSVLDIEIGGGTSNVNYDQIYTATDFVFDGLLNVSRFNGYTPRLRRASPP